MEQPPGSSGSRSQRLDSALKRAQMALEASQASIGSQVRQHAVAV